MILTSHMTSYITCGRRTGCDAGHGLDISKLPPSGYATWLLWSAVSRFLPSQQLEKMVQSTSFSFRKGSQYLRREGDSRADTAGALLVRESRCVHLGVGAGSTAEWALVHIRVTTVA